MPPEIKPPSLDEIEQAVKSRMTEDNEINQALQEFEVKEASYTQAIPQKEVDETPTMVKWIFKLSGGAITEQKQAEYVLLAVVVLIFLISGFLMFGGSRGNVNPNAVNNLQSIHPEILKP